ncbi:MAG: NAD(P)-binding protein [Rhodobacteraceae bacterium]|nr:NAD(P)-binding protein [Paracoccaceae bacterium]
MSDRFDILFEPVQIGPVEAPNRFFAAPHATGHGWTQPAGAIGLRAMKAAGGWGTVAVQMTEIAADSDMANHPMERLWDDGDIPRHTAQVEAIKQHGSLAAIELAHGGIRARNITSAMPVIGPSELPVLRPEVPLQAKAMTLTEIAAFRQSHRAAVRRAMKAGYDIIYVYAAHDLSILSHFLSVRTNHRGDQYGGTFANRLRLLREVLEDTLEEAAGKAAVALRFSVAEPGIPGGLRHDGEGRDTVEALAELPDLWDVNLSGWSADSATARFSDEGFQLAYTDFVKSVTSKPVVGVGRFVSPDLMVSLIRKSRLDLIGAARPSIADPFLPNKIRNGRFDSIRECIGCNICVSMDSYGIPVRCTQNPTISEEWRRGWHPEAPALSRRIQSHLVVGAGPAGLECAATLLRAGQRVTIADSRPVAGGRVTAESQLPGLASWARVRDHRLTQIQHNPDADLYLHSRMECADIVDFGADTVTLATGSRWRGDGVGATNPHPVSFGQLRVFTPDDIMQGEAGELPASAYIVYDDEHYYMASLLAEYLALAGHRVSYVTPLPVIAAWTEFTLEQARIIERLAGLGVSLLPNVFHTGEAHFQNRLTGEPCEFGDSSIVFVGARRSCREIHHELSVTFKADRLHSAGDCNVPGIIQAAVLAGHSTARLILDPEAPAVAREQLIRDPV